MLFLVAMAWRTLRSIELSPEVVWSIVHEYRVRKPRARA
jgi:hypothetical protein